MIFMQKRLVTMKSNLTFVSLTDSVVLACGLLLGGHESWGEETYCIGDRCYGDLTAAVNAITNSQLSGELSRQQIDSALQKYPQLKQALNPTTTLPSSPSIDDLAALPPSESLKRINDIAQSYPGNEYNAINGALEQGVISKQDYVDWMNDGLGGKPLKHLIGPNETLQSVVDGGNISQEKADTIAKALGKESPADVTPEDIAEYEKKAEEEEKEKKKSKSGQTHGDRQEDKDKKDDKKPNNGGCGPGGCKPGGGGGGLGGGGGGGGLLAGLGQAAMQMLPQLLQGMLQNQGNQQGLENQVDQLTQEQLDQNFLNQFVFPTQTAIAQATAFAETATAIAEETAGAEDTSTSNSEEETSEESEATPAPTPIPTPNPYQF